MTPISFSRKLRRGPPQATRVPARHCSRPSIHRNPDSQSPFSLLRRYGPSKMPLPLGTLVPLPSHSADSRSLFPHTRGPAA